MANGMGLEAVLDIAGILQDFSALISQNPFEFESGEEDNSAAEAAAAQVAKQEEMQKDMDRYMFIVVVMLGVLIGLIIIKRKRHRVREKLQEVAWVKMVAQQVQQATDAVQQVAEAADGLAAKHVGVSISETVADSVNSVAAITDTGAPQHHFMNIAAVLANQIHQKTPHHVPMCEDGTPLGVIEERSAKYAFVSTLQTAFLGKNIEMHITKAEQEALPQLNPKNHHQYKWIQYLVWRKWVLSAAACTAIIVLFVNASDMYLQYSRLFDVIGRCDSASDITIRDPSIIGMQTAPRINRDAAFERVLLENHVRDNSCSVCCRRIAHRPF
jgi:hypothetical protein